MIQKNQISNNLWNSRTYFMYQKQDSIYRESIRSVSGLKCILMRFFADHSGVLVLGVVAIHNFCSMMLGLLAAKIFHVEYTRTTAIAIEVGMQNSGLAVSLAAANFAANPLATLPGAIFSVWHNIAGSIFAGIRRSGAENQAHTGENGVSAA